MSAEIINNLQNQLKIYQKMFEELENSSSTLAPTLTSAPSLTSAPLTSAPSISSITDILKPKMRYIQTKNILKLFNISKLQYNNILVRIRKY